MLSVGKINNLTYRSNKLCEQNLSSFGNNFEARKTYIDMNKDVYIDFVDGDISLAEYLGDKLKNFWHILWNEDPRLELKSMMIEKSLKENAGSNTFIEAGSTLGQRYDIAA